MSSYHRIEHGLKDSLSQGQQSRWLRNIGHQQASFSQLHSLKRSGSNKAITFLRIVYPKLYENYSLLGWSNLFLVCPVWFRKNTSTFAILKIACQTSVIGALNGGFRCDTRDTRGDWKTLPSPSRALLQKLCAPITPIIKTIFKEKIRYQLFRAEKIWKISIPCGPLPNKMSLFWTLPDWELRYGMLPVFDWKPSVPIFHRETSSMTRRCTFARRTNGKNAERRSSLSDWSLIAFHFIK